MKTLYYFCTIKIKNRKNDFFYIIYKKVENKINKLKFLKYTLL